MRHLSLAKQIESDAIEDNMPGRNQSPYERAKQKLNAVKIGAIVMAFVFYGGLSAEFGLALGSLIIGGIAALLIPVAIFLHRNRSRLEAIFLHNALNIVEPEAGEIFETYFTFFSTQTGLQLMVKSNYPRFKNQKYVRVIYDKVPNGILYEIKTYYFDEKFSAESMDLQVSNHEPLSIIWDKKLRQELLHNPNMRIEVLYGAKAN